VLTIERDRRSHRPASTPLQRGRQIYHRIADLRLPELVKLARGTAN
jgi:hypothetical protein